MNYFIYTSHHFTPHGRYELNKLASLPMCGFIAQLVEHRTGIAEVTPGVLIDQNLSWKYHIDSIVTKISKNVELIAKLRPLYLDQYY